MKFLGSEFTPYVQSPSSKTTMKSLMAGSSNNLLYSALYTV